MLNFLSMFGIAVLLLFKQQNEVNAFCMSTICSADPDARHLTNRIISCAPDGICGHFRALRRNDQFMEAVDLICREGSAVYAPFEGELSAWRPFEGNGRDEGEATRHEEEAGRGRAACKPDRGVRIDGRGQWRGYHVLIGSVRLFRYSGHVKAGQKIGMALDLECGLQTASAVAANYQRAGGKRVAQRGENFLRVHLHREGRPIDPTHHLIDCMCTGQICETNRVNALEGPPFKFDSRFNGVHGWELKCPDLQPQQPDESGDSRQELLEDLSESQLASEEAQQQRTTPRIYSPIEGEVVGRIRVNSAPGANAYTGCINEAIFIVGSGKWTDYEVRIYNARFLESSALGRQHIEQGQLIGHRLECPGDEIPPTVFMEVRFQGVLTDISDAISAKNCRHKPLMNLMERNIHF